MLANTTRNTTLYKLAGTKSFRLGSAKFFDGRGSNLQNQNKKSKGIYIPDEGKIFVNVDQAGAEAVVVAYITPKGKYRELVEHKVKSHVYVAMSLFQNVWEDKLGYSIKDYIEAPISEVTSLPKWKELDEIIKDSDSWPPAERYYFIGKMVSHSSNYDIKAPTFCLNILQKSQGTVNISNKEANKHLNKYRNELFPEIPAWHRLTQEQLRVNRTLKNLFGYPRVFTAKWSSEMFRDAYSFVPQSTVGTITNIAVTKLQDYITSSEKDWDILNNCHDSYLAQCPIGDELEIATKMVEYITPTLRGYKMAEFTMGASAEVGYSWNNMKEIKL